MGEMSLIYVVCENTEQAKNIAKNLLQKKLCACVNIIDKMQSMFFWPADSEEIQEADETILLIKTIKENFSDINQEVLEMHSYEVPCVFSIDIDDVDGNFLSWLTAQIK
ncbi:MAG: Divalent-cation tolerance protein CutA [Candidatus Anoxychlamydiales bacterium]|nr:Divalent-cation tolerance protein CutA [Candidatus Anoxychlamydiales bacterium]NGX36411.1 Divalent-cation tolerance protein CutA [Candidatus Anoxychlamydiales bacterium]